MAEQVVSTAVGWGRFALATVKIFFFVAEGNKVFYGLLNERKLSN